MQYSSSNESELAYSVLSCSVVDEKEDLTFSPEDELAVAGGSGKGEPRSPVSSIETNTKNRDTSSPRGETQSVVAGGGGPKQVLIQSPRSGNARWVVADTTWLQRSDTDLSGGGGTGGLSNVQVRKPLKNGTKPCKPDTPSTGPTLNDLSSLLFSSFTSQSGMASFNSPNSDGDHSTAVSEEMLHLTPATVPQTNDAQAQQPGVVPPESGEDTTVVMLTAAPPPDVDHSTAEVESSQSVVTPLEQEETPEKLASLIVSVASSAPGMDHTSPIELACADVSMQPANVFTNTVSVSLSRVASPVETPGLDDEEDEDEQNNNSNNSGQLLSVKSVARLFNKRRRRSSSVSDAASLIPEEYRSSYGWWDDVDMSVSRLNRPNNITRDTRSNRLYKYWRCGSDSLMSKSDEALEDQNDLIQSVNYRADVRGDVWLKRRTSEARGRNSTEGVDAVGSRRAAELRDEDANGATQNSFPRKRLSYSCVTEYHKNGVRGSLDGKYVNISTEVLKQFSALPSAACRLLELRKQKRRMQSVTDKRESFEKQASSLENSSLQCEEELVASPPKEEQLEVAEEEAPFIVKVSTEDIEEEAGLILTEELPGTRCAIPGEDTAYVEQQVEATVPTLSVDDGSTSSPEASLPMDDDLHSNSSFASSIMENVFVCTRAEMRNEERSSISGMPSLPPEDTVQDLNEIVSDENLGGGTSLSKTSTARTTLLSNSMRYFEDGERPLQTEIQILFTTLCRSMNVIVANLEEQRQVLSELSRKVDETQRDVAALIEEQHFNSRRNASPVDSKGRSYHTGRQRKTVYSNTDPSGKMEGDVDDTRYPPGIFRTSSLSQELHAKFIPQPSSLGVNGRQAKKTNKSHAGGDPSGENAGPSFSKHGGVGGFATRAENDGLHSAIQATEGESVMGYSIFEISSMSDSAIMMEESIAGAPTDCMSQGDDCRLLSRRFSSSSMSGKGRGIKSFLSPNKSSSPNNRSGIETFEEEPPHSLLVDEDPLMVSSVGDQAFSSCVPCNSSVLASGCSSKTRRLVVKALELPLNPYTTAASTELDDPRVIRKIRSAEGDLIDLQSERLRQLSQRQRASPKDELSSTQYSCFCVPTLSPVRSLIHRTNNNNNNNIKYEPPAYLPWKICRIVNWGKVR